MKLHLIILLLIMITLPLFAKTGEKMTVAVMNWEASSLDESEVISLSDRLRFELMATGQYDVMERNRMNDLLWEQGFQQTGCTSTECVVRVGQLLGVDRMITGSIGKLGRLYTLYLQVIDIEKGRIIQSQVEDCDCPIETVLTQSIRNIVNKIADKTIIKSTLTDIDGNVYQTVKIGKQWWMAENLRVTHYRNGDPIPNVADSDKWAGLASMAYCYYENNSNHAQEYGVLYNGYTIMDSRSIAPYGWHVPTDAEWQSLVEYLGGKGVAGGKLKEPGTVRWKNPNAGIGDENRFCARPGGYRYTSNGDFLSMGSYAFYWSSTPSYGDYAWGWYLCHDRDNVYRRSYSMQDGFSIRLVRD